MLSGMLVSMLWMSKVTSASLHFSVSPCVRNFVLILFPSDMYNFVKVKYGIWEKGGGGGGVRRGGGRGAIIRSELIWKLKMQSIAIENKNVKIN